MNDWHSDTTAFDVDRLATDMTFPMLSDVENITPHALDHDSLLETLVFLDDLDLHMTDLTTPVKLETGLPGPVQHGLVPAHAYTPGALVPNSASENHSAIASVQNLNSKSSRTPSPPASVTSSASPPVSPAPSSTSQSTVSSIVKPKGAVNRSRNRRREELQYLRSLVGELEERLTTLRKRADEQEQETSKRNSEEDVEDDPVLTAVWEDLAARQYAQRQRAEVENNKLRRMLEDQIQVGKSLERLLKRRSNTDDLDVHLPNKRPRCSSVSTAWNNSAIFDELLASLPSLYDELESVMSKVNFDRGTPNFRDIQVHNDPEIGVMLDTTEAHIFPFDYGLTAQHFWSMFLHQTEQDQFHYHNSDCQENVLKVQFGVTVQVARTQGEVNMKIVSRRYVEANRTIVVWAGFCDPTEISDTNMDGIYMRHKGWNIIEPLMAPTTGSPSTTTVGTRMISYMTSVPEAFEDVPDQKRKVGTLTNFMLSTIDVQINARQQQLENRLVELTRGQ